MVWGSTKEEWWACSNNYAPRLAKYISISPLPFAWILPRDVKVNPVSPFTNAYVASLMFTCPTSPEDSMRLVKRVVAIPGDTIELRNNALFINGVRAAYQPLPATDLTYVTQSDRDEAVFANESIGGRSHAVMSYPSARRAS